MGLSLSGSMSLALNAGRALRNLISNGDFSGGTTGWTVTPTESQAVVSGELQVTRATGVSTSSNQAITTVIGRSYRVTGLQRVVSGSCQPNIVARSGPLAADPVIAAGSATTSTTLVTNSFTFTATGTTTYIHLQVGTANGTCGFDNISVR